MRWLILALLALAGGGYGPPAPPITATARAAPGGYIVTWEVSDDADGWRVLVGGEEVYRAAGYLHPGTSEDVAIPAGRWAPGDALMVCATWAPDAGEPDAPAPVEQCQAVAPRLRLWLPQVHH